MDISAKMHSLASFYYYEISLNRWTFNFIFFVGKDIHEFKIPTKYLFTFVILHIVWNPQIQVSTKIAMVVKTRTFVSKKLNDFTVVETNQNKFFNNLKIQLDRCSIEHLCRPRILC